MWNKKKEEEYQPRPAAPSPGAVTRENIPPVPTAPVSSFHTAERGMAVIGKSVMIKGQILSREDLTIDGEVEGSLELHENRLTVGPHGKVQAGIRAREVVILGVVQGNIEASEKIEIRKEARVIGDLRTARVVIEDGAFFKGSIDIVKNEAKTAPPPKAAPQSATPQSVSATSAPAAASAAASEQRR